MKLAWNDKFDGAAIDESKWGFDVGNGFYNDNDNDDAKQWIPGWGGWAASGEIDILETKGQEPQRIQDPGSRILDPGRAPLRRPLPRQHVHRRRAFL